MGVVVKERCAKLLVSKRSLGEAESAWKKKKGRFIPFGRDGREEETYLAELRLDQTFFPHCQRQSFFLPSVFFCAGENTGSVENLPSGSVWGCSAPPAAIWKTISTVCTGCFSKDLMVLFKTKQNKKKRRGSEDFLEYVPAIWIMMEDITGELERPLASMAHGHAFISLQGMDFFIYTFFFLSNKAFSKDQLQKKSLAFLAEFLVTYTARIFCAPALVCDPCSQHIQGQMRIFRLRAESDHFSCMKKS